MKTEHCMSQFGRWPHAGQHILAQYDDHGIIVCHVADLQVARHLGISPSLALV